MGYLDCDSSRPTDTTGRILSRLVFCSKSRWYPSIRREHALAQKAHESGHDVVFIERPHDVRALRSSGRRAWLRQLAAGDDRSENGISVVSRSAVAPGHRGRAAEALDTLGMRSVLHRLGGDVIVASVPWEWPAVSRQGGRRVFDCADDWSEVLPRHRARIRDLYHRIADEADEVICAIDRLTALFATRVPTVVRNGTPTLLLDRPVTLPPDSSRLVYVGTLTERFDTQFVDAALEHLPGWRLDLFGTCQYAGHGDSPDAELGDLLTRRRDRVTLHGPVSREQLGGCLDAGDVRSRRGQHEDL
jgi:hypothetical protein